MFLENLAGPAAFVVATALMFVLVPWERIKSLAWFGLIGGLGVALVLIFLMQNVFGLWEFRQTDFIYLLDIPVFLAATWIPLVVTFGHLMSQYRNFQVLISILLLFPVTAAFTHYLLLENDMLIYSRWSLVLTFILSLAIHAGLAAYLFFTGRLDNLRELTHIHR